MQFAQVNPYANNLWHKNVPSINIPVFGVNFSLQYITHWILIEHLRKTVTYSVFAFPKCIKTWTVSYITCSDLSLQVTQQQRNILKIPQRNISCNLVVNKNVKEDRTNLQHRWYLLNQVSVKITAKTIPWESTFYISKRIINV